MKVVKSEPASGPKEGGGAPAPASSPAEKPAPPEEHVPHTAAAPPAPVTAGAEAEKPVQRYGRVGFFKFKIGPRV